MHRGSCHTSISDFLAFTSTRVSSCVYVLTLLGSSYLFSHNYSFETSQNFSVSRILGAIPVGLFSVIIDQF